ncbi:hypothetical protein [Rhodococcus rhodochrous]|uniref:hypothetical protein n=1 Tax=Rhodococcus rhodochrous TaxID=1829 RepID=UPI001E2D6159|nr:hypothetical protein [Rhodococcus rhodochrous]MCD2100245.1 hypothetical protein [Rhodococcus rhodochrous]MCD2124603.1 hypothetical protein [Rhodococcus rhodochrous]MCQ4137616.1 hypothetical protein [Rhodococcus rhodochrous]MDJ0021399.1 hypothetical protein [Rhodococcus rhodochrous]
MSRAFPFMRPPADVVVAGLWSRVVTDGTEELPQELPDWDYDTVLSIRRPMQVDGLRARRLSGLADDAELDLTVRWAASNSALRGRAWRTGVPPLDGVELNIEFDLDGDELGGILELITVLTLRRSTDGASTAAARRPGSVLWNDKFSIQLQGDANLFPLAIADFHDLPYPTKAGWYLEVGEDLEAAALGSILLLANERRELVVNALAVAGSPTDADRRVLSTLRTDVQRTLIERALTHEDFDDDVDYPTGSLGALLTAVLGTTFPAFTLEALRRERNYEPALFTTRIQDATNFLAGP